MKAQLQHTLCAIHCTNFRLLIIVTTSHVILLITFPLNPLASTSHAHSAILSLAAATPCFSPPCNTLLTKFPVIWFLKIPSFFGSDFPIAPTCPILSIFLYILLRFLWYLCHWGLFAVVVLNLEKISVKRLRYNTWTVPYGTIGFYLYAFQRLI